MAAQDYGRNLVDMFERQASRLGDRPFLWAKDGAAYQPWSWNRVANETSQIRRALAAAGLRPGDRVLLTSENRPEWAVADLAILAGQGVTVPAYTTNTTDDHLHLLSDSAASIAIVSNEKLAAQLFPAIRQVDSVRHVIVIDGPLLDGPLKASIGDITCQSWREALATGASLPTDALGPAEVIDPETTACLIYTSGTGGKPKGVMLTHKNIMANAAGAHAVLARLGMGNEVFLSFLPLSHAYEHMAGQFLPIAIGGEIYYAEGLEALSSNLKEAQPTVMTCVPRLYEVMRQRILSGMARQKGLKPFLFAKAVALGSRAYERPGSLSLLERAFDWLLDRLVRKTVRDRFGGRMKALVSGGAPLNYDVGLFFTALGLPVFQGYGQTECSPVISVNVPGKVKLETVGPPLPGTEVKIAADGEILVSGDSVMKGYWQDPATTAQTVKDGWLHTGDIGSIDHDNYIQITDRKRDFIVLSGGDNIAPQRIEGVLMLEPEIGQVLVYGDRRPHLVALIVPDPDFVKSYARITGKPAELAALIEDPAFESSIGDAVRKANGKLSILERIRRFHLLAEPFSVENGMMTPTLKLKRQIIYRAYDTVITDLYKGRG